MDTRSKPIGLVVPTRWEANPLIRRFHLKRQAQGFFEGDIEGERVLLGISGVGKEAARAMSFRLCSHGVRELVSAGFCGALVPELKVGDLVTHRLATADSPLRTPAERRAITQRANAVAVDMESQAVIEAGTRCGVPIRICRVVSDTTEDDLTPLFGNDVGFHPMRIAVRLLRPSAWPLAGRLRRQSAFASLCLAEALGHLVKTAPSEA
jgi:adenosylhomocysteine nucleosidase